MWLDNLKELKMKAKMSSKQIADVTNLPERTVVRIFSGDTPNPYVDTLYRIVEVLGGSLDDILADTKTIVGSHDLITLQENVDRASNEAEQLKAENAMLKDKVAALSAEIDLLHLTIQHKDEIISLHNYYNSLLKRLEKQYGDF